MDVVERPDRRVHPAAPVPSCPDWNADDLLWHLAEVQWFWAEVVRTRTDDPDTVEAAKPDRPTGREGLTAFFSEATASLHGALTAASPEDRAWTWAAEQTVGFVVRRQAHEALIHRVDAELTAGSRTLMDPRLSADGVDEVLRVMFSDLPAWASFTPDPEGPLRVVATDTDRSWKVTTGRFRGTSPSSGRTYDEPALDVAREDDGVPAAATITGSAADLDCLLWNRPPPGRVTRAGEAPVLAALDALTSAGVQ